MSTKVKVKFEIREAIQELTKKPISDDVGREIVKQIKEFLDKGLSPVRGSRRFAKYKDSDKYPGDRKNRTPVNLKLSGDMLDDLEFWFERNRLMVGWKRGSLSHKKAQTHQYGLNEVPKRPILPVDQGDEFAVSIMRQIREIYRAALLDIIKKSNR